MRVHVQIQCDTENVFVISTTPKELVGIFLTNVIRSGVELEYLASKLRPALANRQVGNVYGDEQCMVEGTEDGMKYLFRMYSPSFLHAVALGKTQISAPKDRVDVFIDPETFIPLLEWIISMYQAFAQDKIVVESNKEVDF